MIVGQNDAHGARATASDRSALGQAGRDGIQRGYLVDKLEAVVQVAAKDALRQLVQAGRLSRQGWKGRYLYCAPDRARRQEQWAARKVLKHPSDDVEAAEALFYSPAG